MDEVEELRNLQKTISDLSDNVVKSLDRITEFAKNNATPEELELAKKIAAKQSQLIKEGKHKEADELINKYRNGEQI
jgi:hypothetical protein